VSLMKTIGRHALALVALALVSSALVAAPAQAWQAKPKPAAVAAKPSARLDTVEILTSRGRARFTVELAVTKAEQERGLMFRKSLAPRPRHAVPVSGRSAAW
jgi:hypothetical protein